MYRGPYKKFPGSCEKLPGPVTKFPGPVEIIPWAKVDNRCDFYPSLVMGFSFFLEIFSNLPG